MEPGEGEVNAAKGVVEKNNMNEKRDDPHPYHAQTGLLQLIRERESFLSSLFFLPWALVICVSFANECCDRDLRYAQINALMESKEGGGGEDYE